MKASLDNAFAVACLGKIQEFHLCDTPPNIRGDWRNVCRGGKFHVPNEIFHRNFYGTPPPNISFVRGGGCFSTAKAFHPNYLQTKPKATQGQSQETHVAVDLKIVPAVAASDQLRQNQSIVEWKQWIKTQDTIWRQRLYLAGRHLSQHHMKCLRSSHEL